MSNESGNCIGFLGLIPAGDHCTARISRLVILPRFQHCGYFTLVIRAVRDRLYSAGRAVSIISRHPAVVGGLANKGYRYEHVGERKVRFFL